LIAQWPQNRAADLFLVMAFALSGSPCVASGKATAASKPKDKPAVDVAVKHEPTPKTAYDFSLPGSDGKDVSISKYRGKVLLIVNLGRKSIYSAQLPALEKLSEMYRDKGLVVVGVPSNDFGNAEPGTDAEVQKSYADAKVAFPVTARAKLTDVQELPFFSYLAAVKDLPDSGNVHWNYTKFIVDREGKLVVRLKPDVAPDSPEMLAIVDQVVSGRFKPLKKETDETPGDDTAHDDE